MTLRATISTAFVMLTLTAPAARAQSYTWNTTPADGASLTTTNFPVGGSMSWSATATAPAGYSYAVLITATDGSESDILRSSGITATITPATRTTTFSGGISTSLYVGQARFRITAWRLDQGGNKVTLDIHEVNVNITP